MTKNDLQNGNIVVTKDGYAGVVIRGEEDYILYQELGMDELDQYHDDLIYDDEDCPDGDIMDVYRCSTFQDIDYEKPWDGLDGSSQG